MTGIEEKSTQEIEASLLQKHEEKLQEEDTVDTQTEEIVEPSVKEEEQEGLDEKSILSYIKERYDKDISSVDELFSTTKENEDLPEDVSAYFKYKKETGRGIEDFVKLQQDYDSMDSDQIVVSILFSHGRRVR